MWLVVQTRIGAGGNCFAACLASILEAPLPEFGSDDGYWKRVDSWLAKYGLLYQRAPLDIPPVGYSTVEGVSPRGGLHACVAKNGKLVWDPHPISDDLRRGLVRPQYYGLLLPLAAKDSVALYPDQDGCRALKYTAKDTHWEPSSTAEKFRQALKSSVLTKTPYAPGDLILLPNGKRAVIAKVTRGENLFHEPEWHIKTAGGEVLTRPIGKREVQDSTTRRARLHRALDRVLAKDAEGDYEVIWITRDYSTNRRVFKNAPDGAPENGLWKARKFAAELERKDDAQPYRNIRGQATVRALDCSRSAK